MNKYDVIILGAGPAGLSAGIYLSRAKKKVLIIDQGTVGGQVILTHAVANYPGVEETSGYSLARTMKKQAKGFGCKIISNNEIQSIDLNGQLKEITTEENIFQADAVIIATGGVPRNLGIESEQKLKGKGISYCATCDGDFFQDQDIIVVGGGNSALEEAVSLTQYAKSVTIVHQFDNFQAFDYYIEDAKANEKISFIMESEVVEFVGDDELKKVILKNNKTQEKSELIVTGAFIFIGYIPNSEMFKKFVDVNKHQEIITDEELQTNIPGVFAAGDVREKKIRQITTAVSDGAISALSAIDYLRKK